MYTCMYVFYITIKKKILLNYYNYTQDAVSSDYT